jgi:hypothetical protein
VLRQSTAWRCPGCGGAIVIEQCILCRINCADGLPITRNPVEVEKETLTASAE